MKALQLQIDASQEAISYWETQLENVKTDYAYANHAEDKYDAKQTELTESMKEIEHLLAELQSKVDDYETEYSKTRDNLEKTREDFATHQRKNARDFSNVRANSAEIHLQLTGKLDATNEKLQDVQAQLTQLSRKLTNVKTCGVRSHHKLTQNIRGLQASLEMHVQNLDVSINGACGQISAMKRRFQDTIDMIHAQLRSMLNHVQPTLPQLSEEQRRQTLELRNLNKRMQVENLNLNNKLERCTEFVCRLDKRVEQNTEAMEGLSMHQDFTDEQLEETKKELKELKRFVRYMQQAEKTKNKRQFRYFMKKLSGMRKEFFLGGAVICAMELCNYALRAMVTTLF